MQGRVRDLRSSARRRMGNQKFDRRERGGGGGFHTIMTGMVVCVSVLTLNGGQNSRMVACALNGLVVCKTVLATPFECDAGTWARKRTDESSVLGRE